MSLVDRDAVSADALLTDLYLDALLAGVLLDADDRRAGAIAGDIDPAARSAADRLRRDLVRVHPSFRFEERLAARLAEAAAAMRLPAVVGGDARVVPFPLPGMAPEQLPPDAHADDDDDVARDRARPLLIGGALTSAALSIAGAAFVAWRRNRPSAGTTPMARAVRKARLSATRDASTRRRRRPSATRRTARLD
jgi:hypothetical protein